MKCSIFFSTPKAWYIPAIITVQENKVFWLIPKKSVLGGQSREKNSQCSMTEVGLGQSPQPPEARSGGRAPGKGFWGQSSKSLAIFAIFNKNNTFLGLNFCLKIFS